MHRFMKGCRRILVAYDGSPAGRHALEDALAVAEWQHASLTILFVVPPVPTLVLAAGAGPAIIEHAGAKRDAIAAIADLDQWIPESVPYTTSIRFGAPEREILDVLDGGS